MQKVRQNLRNTALPMDAVAIGNGAYADTIAAAIVGTDYEAVAASATNQAMGATGAVGDLLAGVLIVPATTSPGAVQIKDGVNAAITIFAGGATSVADLKPIFVPLNMRSTNGAWQITTGTNVSAIGIGDFT